MTDPNLTLAEIGALLEHALAPSGDLTLATGMFTALDAALAAAGTTSVALTGATVAGDGDPVTARGSGSMYGSTTAGTVDLVVTGGATITATLTFTAPGGWTFAQGVPGLPDSYRSADELPGAITDGPSILYALTPASATLTTSSTATTIAVAATLQSAAPFGILAAPLGLGATPALSGTIELAAGGGAPTVDLRVPASTPTLPIGSALTFDGAGFRVSTTERDPQTDGPLTRLDLDATLDVGATNPVAVELSAPVYEQATSLTLAADFGAPGLTFSRGIQAFADLLGIDVGTFTLPSPLDILDAFGLHRIVCVVDPTAGTVQRLVIIVGPGTTWPITTGVEVDDLEISWMIETPFDGTLRTTTAMLIGTLNLGTVDPKLAFTIEASTAQDFTISGALAHPMTLEQIATTVNGAAVSGLPDLTVQSAEITASASGDFSLLVAVEDWQLGTIGTTLIELVDVDLALSRAGSSIHGAFHTVFGVGSVRVALAAELDLGAPGAAAAVGGAGGAEWVFSGGTVPGTEIPIGELLSQLADFGITEVPEPIRTLSLKDLQLTYDTAKQRFTFHIEADFQVDATPVALTIGIVVQPTSQAPVTDPPSTVAGSKGYSATFTGELAWSGVQFDLVFDVGDASGDVFIADYVSTGGDPVSSLRDLVAHVAPTVAADIPAGMTIGLDEVKFVFLKQTATQWAFGLRLGAGIDLSELPVVGSRLPAGETLSIDDLQVLYSSAALTATQTTLVNGLLPKKVTPLPPTAAQGIAFDADLRLGGRTQHVHAGVTPPPAQPPAALPGTPAFRLAAGGHPLTVGDATSPPASSSDPVKWFDVNKQFGIFSFRRVGLGYVDNVLEFALDASVALGPIAFSMDALTVGSPLTAFEPRFGLRGLSLAFDLPPISIGGAFLRVDEQVAGRKTSAYYGELMVQVSEFSLRAVGGWAPDADPASFFIYLSLDAPLGGPPFFFVTGVAAGFGINSALTLPTIDEVGSYPLLPAKAPKQQASAADTIKDVIPALQRVFHPEAGEYWIAAGVAFTSFEMIEAQAVVSVAFGVDLQIGVVGTCAMTFPTGDPDPVAYVEIDIVASFTPSTGLLAIDGKLSPASYVFGGFVKLSGGFALYAWFSGEHAGDFVVSLGGYHPAFDRPSNYPVVPRLELSFALGPVKVIGQTYFALVPSGFMAGLRMTATFEAGPIKAWFDAGIDVLIMWAPFHYDAHAWITIGCSVDLGLFTIDVQIGADLEVWGPAFGGSATVDLDIVSFTIAFGAERAAPLPIGWDTLAENFLPAATDSAPHAAPHAAMLAAGLAAAAPTAPATTTTTNVVTATATGTRTGMTVPPGIDWILKPTGFRIVAKSTVPANHAQWVAEDGSLADLPNVVADYGRAPADPRPGPAGTALGLDADTTTYSATQVWQPTLHIAPMDRSDVDSYLVVALRRFDSATGGYTDAITAVTISPQLSPAATALWGQAPASTTDPNVVQLVPAALVGLAITPVPRHPDQISDVPLLELIYGEGHETGFAYDVLSPDARYTVGGSPDGAEFTITVGGLHTAQLQSTDYALGAIADDWVSEQRTATLDALTALGFSTPPSGAVSVERFAATTLTDWPSAALIGAQA